MRPCPIALCFIAALIIAGCAQRTLYIQSDPTGALVYLNGEEIGRTPLKYDFTWYSNYDVVLRKSGYETLKTSRKLKAPLMAIPPFDLFGELFGSKDVREWSFTMQQAVAESVNDDVLLDRASQLKAQLQGSENTRAPKTQPTTTTAPSTNPTTIPATQPRSTTRQ